MFCSDVYGLCLVSAIKAYHTLVSCGLCSLEQLGKRSLTQSLRFGPDRHWAPRSCFPGFAYELLRVQADEFTKGGTGRVVLNTCEKQD